MAQRAVLAIDQGSGSTKAFILDQDGNLIARGIAPVHSEFPQPGWVEQDPEQIWASVCSAVGQATANLSEIEITAIGLSTQRESLVYWSRKTGKPLGPVLTWQDRRSSHLLEKYISKAHIVRKISGLPLDPMFSALKAAYVLSEIEDSSDVLFGTIDSWLLWKFGAGHKIEIGNASRTQLLDVETGRWSKELLELFGIKESQLPEVVGSDFRHSITTDELPGVAVGTQISGVLGDSHAALFAHAGWKPGIVKATYGTGSSVMAVGPVADPATGMCTTITWSINGKIVHGVEGNILSSGSTLTWLSRLFDTSVDELLSDPHVSSEGVYIVPAFNGLGAPWWDEKAVGVITGITLNTERSAIVNAALDSIAMQITDVLDAMRMNHVEISELKVDGGATKNASLLQRQADYGNVNISVPDLQELSGIGAAYFAGIAAGIWSTSDIERKSHSDIHVEPRMKQEEREKHRRDWQIAVGRARMRS